VTVGQGGGLPVAEWTLASVLKTGGYKTFFTGKWHLGEADYALPIADGYDEIRYVGLYLLKLTPMGIRPGFRIPHRVRCSTA
jgi:arylsulfatase A-like enzyme